MFDHTLRRVARSLFVVAAFTVGAAGAAETAKPADIVKPSLSVKTVDGQTFDLAQHRGHWVVVNFWATWCAPCLKEIPDLSAFDQAREDVTVIGLAYDEIELIDLKLFLQQHPASYPIALIDVYDPPKDFETPRGLPMTYLLSPEGTVARKFLGPVTSKELEAAIAAATPKPDSAKPDSTKPEPAKSPG